MGSKSLPKTRRTFHLKELLVGYYGYLENGSVIIDESDHYWIDTGSQIAAYTCSEYTIKVTRINGDYQYELHTPNFGHQISFSQSYMLLNDDRYHRINISKDKRQAKTIFSLGTEVSVTQTNRSDMEMRKEILNPLFSVFMEPSIINEVLIRTSVPEIIRCDSPVFNGVILYGKGGTGKTQLMKAIGNVYENAGCISKELNLAKMSEKFIGSLANNLDEQISEIETESRKTATPAFIYLDEATSIIMSSDNHNESGVDYYQEAVDVLKKYISNYSNLVFCITTNFKPDIFDDTLIREGRLEPIHIPLPGLAEKNSMWDHYMKQYDVLPNISKKQCEKLSELIPDEQGAFINEFCKSYIAKKKLKTDLKSIKSKFIIDVLLRGDSTTIDDIKQKVTFRDISTSVKNEIDKKYKRDTDSKQSKKTIKGFIG